MLQIGNKFNLSIEVEHPITREIQLLASLLDYVTVVSH